MEKQSSPQKAVLMKKPNNMLSIETSLDTDFFKWWCSLIRPFVPLTKTQIDVVAAFLKQRYELSKVISDPAIVDAQLMSETVRQKIIEECHITLPHFYVTVSNLRKNKVIENNTINPKLIPNLRKDDNGTFQFLILLKYPIDKA